MGQFKVGDAEKIAAVVVSAMIREAAYRGEEVSVADLSQVIAADPDGATANYFRRTAADALDWLAAFRADPELMAAFSEVRS